MIFAAQMDYFQSRSTHSTVESKVLLRRFGMYQYSARAVEQEARAETVDIWPSSVKGGSYLCGTVQLN